MDRKRVGSGPRFAPGPTDGTAASPSVRFTTLLMIETCACGRRGSRHLPRPGWGVPWKMTSRPVFRVDADVFRAQIARPHLRAPRSARPQIDFDQDVGPLQVRGRFGGAL